MAQQTEVPLSEVVVEDASKKAVIKNDQIKSANQDIVDAIYNRVSGARITSDYTGKKNIALRGRQSFSTQSDTVLWDIDGLIFTSPPPMDISQVKYVEVLKDLSATNKYGSQGGAGVVVIKTVVSENSINSSRNLWNQAAPLTKEERDSIRKAKKAARKSKKKN
jgi:hypothetical protein